MSQMTAAARPLRAPRRTPAAVPLRVIPTRITHSGNGAVATLCVALLTAGLIALLVLNTALAQGSLVLAGLQRDSARLSDTAGNLQEEIDRSSATGALARSAASLGMVRMNQRGYIDLTTGKVSGKPEPATRNNALPIVTSPTPPKVTAQVKKLLDSATAAAVAKRAEAAGAGHASTATGTPQPSQTRTSQPSSSQTPQASPSQTPEASPSQTAQRQPPQPRAGTTPTTR